MKKYILYILSFWLIGTGQIFAQNNTKTLSECLRIAMDSNLSIAVAREGVAFSLEKRKEVSSSIRPKAFAAFDYRLYGNLPTQLLPADAFGGPSGVYKEAEFGVPHIFNLNVQANYPLYNPAARAAVSVARLGALSAELQVLKTREETAYAVSATYYQAQIAANQVLFLEGNIRNLVRLAENMRLLKEQLLAKGSDVDKIVLQHNLLLAQLAAAKAGYEQAVNALKFQMGQSAESVLTIPATPDSLASNAGSGSPAELLLLQHQQQTISAETKTARAARLPVVSLYGFYGYNGFGKTGDNAFFKEFPLSYIGMQAAVPLYDGGLTRSRLNQKAIEQRRVSQQEQLLREKYDLDRRNAELNIRANWQIMAAQRGNIQLAERLFEQTQTQLREGVATVSDVLQAENTVREAQNNYLNALVKLRVSELDRMRAAGLLPME
ncbi:MAG: TolC family protein [Saprospiraceae bacterium]|nr:TolC family protein [Saprospiraceae bacterium]